MIIVKKENSLHVKKIMFKCARKAKKAAEGAEKISKTNLWVESYNLTSRLDHMIWPKLNWCQDSASILPDRILV